MALGALTPKQNRFVEEYLIDLNATQAAIRAGYSKNSARQIGDVPVAPAHGATANCHLREKNMVWESRSACYSHDRRTDDG